jgi:hypothetical protein
MTRAQVKASESATLRNEDKGNFIMYSDIIIENHCFIGYTFKNDRLISGLYFIDNDQDYEDLQAYERMKDLLIKKYGKPDYDGQEQRNPEERLALDTYGKMAAAIANGDVTLKCVWEYYGTRIILLCVEDEKKVNALLKVLYFDLENLKKEDEEKREKADIDAISKI